MLIVTGRPSPELEGTGEPRRIGYTVGGTARHFDTESGKSLCGIVLDLTSEDDDWVSCRKCRAAARSGK